MSASGGVVAHIRSMVPSLLPTEQAVAQVFLDRSSDVIDMSSQQVADAAGASRATVVRTCQSLGYSGYQQLRVLLTRDAGTVASPTDTVPQNIVRRAFSHVAESMSTMTALLDDGDLDRVVQALATAVSTVVIGNGLSAPLASDAAARLSAMGLRVAAPVDVIAQQIASRMLGPSDVLLVFSGSGSTASSLRPAQIGRRVGALVVVVTAFARSPIALEADVALVVGMGASDFRAEVTATSRIPQFILLEGLVAAVFDVVGESAASHHAANLEVIGENLSD
ncbi:MurR/RpiR family transcriptional regulator [Actinomycetes bacterium M1A6_2h]